MRTTMILFAGAMLTSATFAGVVRPAVNQQVHAAPVAVATSTLSVADGFGTEERFRLKYGRTLASFHTPTSPRPVAASVAPSPCAAKCCKHAV